MVSADDSPQFIISLDACVFFAEKQKWQLTHAAFGEILRLRAAGIVEIVITDVVKHEVRALISRLSQEILVAHETAHAALGGQQYDRAEIEDKLARDFDALCQKARIIESSRLEVGGILDRYWNHRPPFSKPSKRNEFPDAISLMALIEWSRRHGEIHVVSDDPDWENACKESGRIDSGKLSWYKKLTDLLAVLVKRSGNAVELRLIAAALQRAVENAPDDLNVAVEVPTQVTVLYLDRQLDNDDFFVTCRLVRSIFNDCDIYRISPSSLGAEEKSISAVARMTFDLQFDVEIQNPDYGLEPMARRTLQIRKRHRQDANLVVEATYDPVSQTCRMGHLYLEEEILLEFELKPRGANYALLTSAERREK